MVNEFLHELFITNEGSILIETDKCLYELHADSYSTCIDFTPFNKAQRTLEAPYRDSKILDIVFENEKRYLILINHKTEVFGLELHQNRMQDRFFSIDVKSAS